MTFLDYAAGMDGDLHGARATFARLNKIDAKVPLLFVLLRYRLWSEILALPAAGQSPYEPLRAVVWRFARAMAFAANGNVAAATRERRLMAAAGRKARLPAIYGFTNSSAAIVSLADDEIDAKIAGVRHRSAVAIALLRSAVRKQDRFIYIEPPDWYAPAREALGGELLRAGRAREAADVFRADLKCNPSNPRSLYGLATADAALSDPSEAATERILFMKAWKSGVPAPTLQGL